MASSMVTLCLAAVSIGFFHTLLGPDHYVPFVAMAKAGQWSLKKTLIITTLCGLGHIASSAVLGLLGVSMGIGISKIEGVESTRGQFAAWMLLAFGLAYLAWGLRKAVRNQPHRHLHAHPDGIVHSHDHLHRGDHIHVHAANESNGVDANSTKSTNLTPWVLFSIFLFGPCEPLIPLLMYPAAQGSMASVVIVTSVFGAVTISTMLGLVSLIYWGLRPSLFAQGDWYSHALAGLAIAMCAGAILVFDV